MGAEKVSVSLPDDLLAQAREVAAERGESLSLWLRGAVEGRLRQHSFDDFVSDWERRHGALSEDELRRADRALGFDQTATA